MESKLIEKSAPCRTVRTIRRGRSSHGCGRGAPLVGLLDEAMGDVVAAPKDPVVVRDCKEVVLLAAQV